MHQEGKFFLQPCFWLDLLQLWSVHWGDNSTKILMTVLMWKIDEKFDTWYWQMFKLTQSTFHRFPEWTFHGSMSKKDQIGIFMVALFSTAQTMKTIVCLIFQSNSGSLLNNLWYCVIFCDIFWACLKVQHIILSWFQSLSHNVDEKLCVELSAKLFVDYSALSFVDLFAVSSCHQRWVTTILTTPLTLDSCIIVTSSRW